MMTKKIGKQLIAFLLLMASYHLAQASELLKPCRVEGFAEQVKCGQIQRPLDPDEPRGKQIDVHFIVLAAQDKSKISDPVFLLAGGPGQSAINVASYLQILFDKLQRRHDLVFVDQRGTGRSAPLKCQDESDNLKGIGDADYEVKQALQCMTELKKLPYGDLRFFTTSIAMQDLETVRAALGYSMINLIGVSYGTRAALEYMRQYPDKVKRAVFDGVVEPDKIASDEDLQKAFNNLLNDCENDARCKKSYPTLRQDWKTLLTRFPQMVQLTHPRMGTKITATITRDDVLAWVTKIIYSPVSSSALPSAIEQAANGNFNPMLTLSGAGNLPGQGRIFEGMHLSVACSEENFQQSTSPNNEFAGIQNKAYIKVCEQWPRGKVPEGFYTVSASQSPVLLLSGGLDPVTPPWRASRMAKALGPNAREIVLKNAGHGMLQQTCVADVVTQFINGKTNDASCVKQFARPSVWIAPEAR